MKTMNKKTQFRLTCLAVAVVSTLSSGHAMAAGVAGAVVALGASASQLNAGTVGGGIVDVTTGVAITGNTTVTGTLGVTGAATTAGVTNTGNVGTTTLSTTGAATVGTTLGVTGQTTTAGIGNTGGLTQTGVSTLVGTTSINDTGAAATTLNTGASTGNVTIGNVGNTTSLNSMTNNIGVNAFATTNNIGTNATFSSINALGSTNVSTTVTARGGNTTLSLANNTASLTAGPTLATNGITGTTSGTGSGGLTVYNAAQTIAASATIPTGLLPTGILAGKTYQNKVSGNLLVDGNVYINGTLDYVSSNSANTTVIGATPAGSSIIAGATAATTGGTAIVMKGSTGNQTVSDANGKLTNVVAAAAQSSASLTLTNGLGNTHGILVTETQTVISGGTHSTSLTFDNNDVTFRNAQTGAPIQVHGVADGTSDFDAVNVRQLGAGIASVSAMTNIPQLDTGKNFAMGVGYGYHLGQSALAVGGTLRYNERTVIKSSLAIGTGSAAKPTFGIGAAISW